MGMRVFHEKRRFLLKLSRSLAQNVESVACMEHLVAGASKMIASIKVHEAFDTLKVVTDMLNNVQ